ncbi:MAG TPA: LysR substrate-binding domain-containing protein [Ramlibacter sp.]|uniref:LysR substrate-binding domain-containing protein n=1 Tax=Ramlibacter sp. TaxID=1917967 RepID=UPI002CF50C18|nr:LysR substrate-binding domain-containing protein [Ramlibacter sp.]HVZ45920.1 LysR substrate-binding domain-containing protein [Ramlibacter sp.]
MDLKQLEYFVKVAEFGSFSRAATAMHVEQPAVSKQVRLLEVELRQTLLTRTGRGVIPTAAGRLLLDHGRGILHQMARVREELGRVQGALAGRVAVGMSPSIARVLAAPLILDVRERLPQVVLAVSEGMTQSMQEAVVNGSLDAAFLYNPTTSPDLISTLLVEEELFLVQKSVRPGAESPREASIEELARLPLVMPTRPNTLRLLVETEMASRGCKPVIAFEVDGVPTILDLVADGAGSTLLSRRAVKTSPHAGRFTIRRIAGPPVRSRLSLVVSSQRPPTLTQQAVLDIIVPPARKLLA